MSYLNLLNLLVAAGAVASFFALLRWQQRNQDQLKLRRIRIESQEQLERFRRQLRRR